LVKKPDERLNCTDLLKEAFIVNYIDKENDLELIKRVIDEVKKDVIEA
jgi:hypothetical protein